MERAIEDAVREIAEALRRDRNEGRERRGVRGKPEDVRVNVLFKHLATRIGASVFLRLRIVEKREVRPQAVDVEAADC